MKKDSLLKLLALSGVPLIMVLGNSMLIPVFPDMERALDISKFQAGLTITLLTTCRNSYTYYGFYAIRLAENYCSFTYLIWSWGLSFRVSNYFFNKSFQYYCQVGSYRE